MQAFVGPNVQFGKDVKIHPFAYIDGTTTIGDGCEIFPFAAIGTPPQDLSYKGTPTRVVIGERCVFREGVTIHRASEKETGETVIGSRCYFMANAHVGHDCRVGDDVIITNNTVLAGHVIVEERAVLSGQAGIHQFCRIGTLAMIAGGTIITQDIPPYCLAQGWRARLLGLNEIGLERRGFKIETIHALRKAYRTVFRSEKLMKDAIAATRSELGSVPEVERFLAFIEGSKRGVARHGSGGR
jgi:UDP-N-acetylglucosamine acyltransferase